MAAAMEGFLSKWTNVMKGWQYRWFVLDENAGILSYYTSKEKMMRGVRRGCVRLRGAVIGIDDEDDSTFTITVDHKTFHFQARNAADRERWVRALEDTILRHGGRGGGAVSPYMAGGGYLEDAPALRHLDDKVSEADAYLQLLIEQTRELQARVERCEERDPQRATLQLVLRHANDMLDSIKHSIVLLQIAKNTAHPVNGLYQPLPLGAGGGGGPGGEQPAQPLVELGAECCEPPVPETSYSSSEGEEDFFDANDAPFTPTGGGGAKRPDDAAATALDEKERRGGRRESQLPPSQQQQATTVEYKHAVDYESLYEEEDGEQNGGQRDGEPDGEDESMEKHGSVITHLLSQVKIGMDLTKVVLPTFILERRSLLEMYADYFAHPDLFVRIAELTDARDRMVQVVRWYLSSYHAGRKSSVAKKPYNPVLGETFRCWWEVPAGGCGAPQQPATNAAGADALAADGPVPWSSPAHLTFVAEQVSHHPPVSAFYAEHVGARISFNAHVYTKSKFLGLSVCVYNIGQGIVSVLDHNEEYIVTFPNGYGRSILTVPWIELGGSVTITCQKTGYHCNVEFLTKPFYGNKKHRVTADVFGPHDRKPFLTVAGEWNGLMEARWADKGEAEVFVDVSRLQAVRKQVRPLSQQEENESRWLWREVTAGLKCNDIERATAAKQRVEQRQRDLAKERQNSNARWETRLFKQAGESWLYGRPLLHRLTLRQAPAAAPPQHQQPPTSTG